MGLVGDGERMTRVNLLLEVEQLAKVRALADDLGRRGVKSTFRGRDAGRHRRRDRTCARRLRRPEGAVKARSPLESFVVQPALLAMVPELDTRGASRGVAPFSARPCFDDRGGVGRRTAATSSSGLRPLDPQGARCASLPTGA